MLAEAAGVKVMLHPRLGLYPLQVGDELEDGRDDHPAFRSPGCWSCQGGGATTRVVAVCSVSVTWGSRPRRLGSGVHTPPWWRGHVTACGRGPCLRDRLDWLNERTPHARADTGGKASAGAHQHRLHAPNQKLESRDCLQVPHLWGYWMPCMLQARTPCLLQVLSGLTAKRSPCLERRTGSCAQCLHSWQGQASRESNLQTSQHSWDSRLAPVSPILMQTHLSRPEGVFDNKQTHGRRLHRDWHL